MPRRVPLTTMRQISEINLTPLMDLTFILLITFIITFPLIEQGIPVNLPRGNASELSPDRAVTISIDKNNVTYLDEKRISHNDLRSRMLEIGQADGNVTVMVRADERIRYARIIDVLKILHEAKIQKMALVTQAEK